MAPKRNADVFAMAEEDASTVKSSDADLKVISTLAEKQLNLEQLIRATEDALETHKKALQRVSEQDLPEAMDKAGLSEFALKSGAKVKVSPFYSASIPPERKGEAFFWLDNHGFGTLIKTEVAINFGKGGLEIAKKVLAFLHAISPILEFEEEPKLEQGVHYQTLKAFVREQIETPPEDPALSLPRDLFGVFVGRKTKITEPKKKD